MDSGMSKWSLIESHVIRFNKNDVQMEAGNPNEAWDVQMEPGKSKWSLIECDVISFNKNDVQMEPGGSKWSLGGPNGAWEVQMELN